MSSIIQVKKLCKRYPGVLALDNISLEIEKGRIYCLVGENGAGKSTFIKILTGAAAKDSGEIYLNGKPFNPKNTREALDAGISTIFQELNVLEHLNVEKNLILGREPNSFGFLKKVNRNDHIFTILSELDPSIKLNAIVGDLSVAQKQTIEIAKALGSSAELIILDEPTAALSENETRRLFDILKGLRKQNVTAIYVSHRLEEIFEIGDEIVVFRDGNLVAKKPVTELGSRAEIIQLMIGKVVAEQYKPSAKKEDTTALSVRDLTTKKLKSVSFDIKKGEIAGFYGLMGSGKTEIARALFSLDEILSGEITLHGKKSFFKTPRNAINNGVFMVPEERRTAGIFGNQTILQNICVSNFRGIAKLGFINNKKARNKAAFFMEKLSIKARNMFQIAGTLSGGNQQKVVVSKSLNAESSLLLLDEPTRGIDVGGKEEIHNLIRELSASGVSIIVFSSELPEVLNLCDTLFFLRHGEIVKTMKNSINIEVNDIFKAVAGE